MDHSYPGLGHQKFKICRRAFGTLRVFKKFPPQKSPYQSANQPSLEWLARRGCPLFPLRSFKRDSGDRWRFMFVIPCHRHIRVAVGLAELFLQHGTLEGSSPRWTPACRQRRFWKIGKCCAAEAADSLRLYKFWLVWSVWILLQLALPAYLKVCQSLPECEPETQQHRVAACKPSKLCHDVDQACQIVVLRFWVWGQEEGEQKCWPRPGNGKNEAI